MTHGHGIMLPVEFGMRVAMGKFLRLPSHEKWKGVRIDELSLADALDYWDAVIATEEGDAAEYDE